MRYTLIILVLVGGLFSCSEITELNDNPKGAEDVSANSLIANAELEIFDQMVSTNVNVNTLRLWAQHWTQTTYTDESNFELVERDVNGNFYDVFYAQALKDISVAAEKFEATEVSSAYTDENKRNDIAIAEVLSVYCYHVLVDVFGDIPYDESVSDIVTPKYDDDEEIYNDLFARLNIAIDNLGGTAGLGSNDLVYGGDADKWKKFANSLKLRMAIRISDVNPTASQMHAEAAYQSGVITSSADDAQVQYTSAKPNTNPLWEDLVESGRNDFVVANTLGDIMNDLNDPRREHYAQNLWPMDSINGGAFGGNNSFAGNSQITATLEDPTYPGTILSYTEVLFLLSDAAKHGYSVGGSAEDYYNQAIMNSVVADWGGDESEAQDYINNEAAYDGSDEQLGTQKWIGMYNRGFEAWSTYRLYDAPEMNVAASAGTVTPLRFTYPNSEYSLNEASVRASGIVSSTMGDDPFNRIFWDE